MTKARDEVNALRRELPMVEITKDYVFDTSDGPRSLEDLFDGRNQLIIYHFMFDPARPAPTQPLPREGCVSCSHTVDSIGHLAHIHARDTSLVLVSRAPLDAIEEFKSRMGWTVPWVSSAGSDFNHDFTATVETEQYAGEIPGSASSSVTATGTCSPTGRRAAGSTTWSRPTRGSTSPPAGGRKAGMACRTSAARAWAGCATTTATQRRRHELLRQPLTRHPRRHARLCAPAESGRLGIRPGLVRRARGPGNSEGDVDVATRKRREKYSGSANPTLAATCGDRADGR